MRSYDIIHSFGEYIYSCFDAPNNVLPINSTCLITHANFGSVKDFSAL